MNKKAKKNLFSKLPNFFSIALVTLLSLVGSANAQTTELDSAAQGLGNKGTSFRPTDSASQPAPFVMTAKTLVNNLQPFSPTASSQIGTVYIDTAGAGVQTASAGGSKGISGSGGDQNEELRFTFDTPTYIHDISMTLTGLKYGSGANNYDDPVLFLKTAAAIFTVQEAALQNITTFVGSEEGFIKFRDLESYLSLSATTAIEYFIVRETYGHIYVNNVGINPSVAVPEPTSMLILGSSLAMMARRRMQKKTAE